MAKTVLALGTSHGPMLSTPPEQWGLRAEADRANSRHPFRGRGFAFEELRALRLPEGLSAQLGLEQWRGRHAACLRAIAVLRQAFVDAAPDVAVIVGNDQRELFGEHNQPALAVYWGDAIENVPLTPDQLAHLPPGLAIAETGHCPSGGAKYPGEPALARHLIESLSERFDVTALDRLVSATGRRSGIPHAYGFVYRQIMGDQAIPSVPVILNTFYPPNRPSVARCHALGKALARAIDSWDSETRVALIGSGGLSHFVIDEELDRRALEAMSRADDAAIESLPEAWFEAGTSEVKNWVPVAAAGAETGLRMELVDYVPCYRTDAGTGNAMGFACWRS